jgi:hypothetical protein
MSGDADIVWYWSYMILPGPISILCLIILDLHLYMEGTISLIYLLAVAGVWLPLMLVGFIVSMPLRMGLSDKGVHIIYLVRRKFVKWEDIEFIGRSFGKLSNNYGVVTVFDSQSKVYPTGKFGNKILELMNHELLKRRRVSS